jgi:hypothetical protein
MNIFLPALICILGPAFVISTFIYLFGFSQSIYVEAIYTVFYYIRFLRQKRVLQVESEGAKAGISGYAFGRIGINTLLICYSFLASYQWENLYLICLVIHLFFLYELWRVHNGYEYFFPNRWFSS